MAYTDRLNRTGSSRTAREIPESVANDILTEAVQGSAALQVGHTFRMAAYQHRVPVLSAFAEAFWLDGATQSDKDSAQKQTTKVEWDNVYITPEELAVLVPVPDAWMADSNIAWEEIKREVTRAFSKKIDEAIFFGAGGVPSTFGNGIVPDAIANGNYVTVGDSTVDLADDIAMLGQEMAEDGYNLDGFVTEPAFLWRLRRLRDANDVPIFEPSLQAGTPSRLYGQTLTEVTNGAWDRDEAALLAGEWDKLKIGIRQDMTFQLFDQAVITDGSGNVVYNSVQQDGKVLRAVMRLGYATPNPLKVLGGTYPFYILANDAPAS
jgi:HK97 family phage major capsid protein